MIPVAFAGCLGWLHPAAGARGVVLCPPWGFEALCVHRSLAETAEALASAGLPCLRLDLPATGESLDPPPGAPVLARWIDALLEAIACLRARTGIDEVALVGLRLGALLASAAASRSGGVARLALLAPPPAGRAYVRELRAWARLANGGPATQATGGVDRLVAGGFALDEATLSALCELDPLAAAAPPAPRILILERPDAPSLAGAFGRWAGCGAGIELAPFEGYSELMRDPLLAEPPRAAIARLVRFLAEGSRVRAAAGRRAEAPAEAVLEGPGFVQRTLTFGCGGRLVGTLTEPARGSCPADRPALLVLNTGATHRVGAGRSAVELTRALARDGVRSLRLDLGGIGDSALPPGERSGDIYRRGALAEVAAALDLLAERGSPRVVGLGVCSGAFMAFHAALADPRLVGLVLVNLPRFGWRPFHPLVFVRTRALLALLGRPAVWRRGLAGRGELWPALRVLGERLAVRLVVRLPRPIREAAAALSRPARAMRALLRRGVRLLVLYADDDPGLPLFERVVGGGHSRLRDGRLEVRVVEGAGHTFADPAARALLLELVRAHLGLHAPARAAPPAIQHRNVAPRAAAAVRAAGDPRPPEPIAARAAAACPVGMAGSRPR